jgi:hypothetical protein
VQQEEGEEQELRSHGGLRVGSIGRTSS